MARELVCSDCNEVLNNVIVDYSRSNYYSNISNDNLKLYNKINEFLFYKIFSSFGKKYLISPWIADEIAYKDINKVIDNYFDEIFNSSGIKHLKDNNDSELYKIIVENNNLDLFEILAVNDSERIIEEAEEIDLNTFLYNQDNYRDFENALIKMI